MWVDIRQRSRIHIKQLKDKTFSKKRISGHHYNISYNCSIVVVLWFQKEIMLRSPNPKSLFKVEIYHKVDSNGSTIAPNRRNKTRECFLFWTTHNSPFQKMASRSEPNLVPSHRESMCKEKICSMYYSRNLPSTNEDPRKTPSSSGFVPRKKPLHLNWILSLLFGYYGMHIAERWRPVVIIALSCVVWEFYNPCFRAFLFSSSQDVFAQEGRCPHI